MKNGEESSTYSTYYAQSPDFRFLECKSPRPATHVEEALFRKNRDTPFSFHTMFFSVHVCDCGNITNHSIVSPKRIEWINLTTAASIPQHLSATWAG